MSKCGDRIRVLRIKHGLTQVQLADAISKSMGIELKRSALGNYERGIREPDLDTIEAFADYFDTSVADIMGREENESQTTQKSDREIINMPPSKVDRWIMLSNAFGQMELPEFDMWFNAIRANHPDFFNDTERNDDDDPES